MPPPSPPGDPLSEGRFRGTLYRALNPVYARTPLSGRGAERYGGRFNPKGMAALYTALDPATALREANQVGDLQPTTLVAYRADIGPVFDTRDRAALSHYGLGEADLGAADWRSAMLDQRPVPTQDLARALRRAGFAGLLVRSFARSGGSGQTAPPLNLVLWDWHSPSAELGVIDDENRLDLRPE
ncbi:RES domain protein [Aquimixticola soesokkakensis]|uniref:RES domain protein n=1 Tax=Aquimixticola soesokkakensis TaxID=1519096 RepID=A0A1Y5RZ06_9RHOB|nr:RES family NAD+ phosphorylase [Aquimixticola soesokkakensis]SLN26169.1 RES domain protein [Aquimixticola soesokkakensis]